MIFNAFKDVAGSAQWPLHLAEGFLPTTIKSHLVGIVITWSISQDENDNIGQVHTSCLLEVDKNQVRRYSMERTQILYM